MVDAPAIELEGLSKRFRVSRRDAGLWPALRALFVREWIEVEAVRELSFSIAAGERVGFLGPNGAGKTTTLKMLAGLLHPSAGTARVLGHTPADREPAFLRRIALVTGQKRQLSWDLPALDTFALNRVVFEVSRSDYERRLAQMSALLDIEEVVRRPVRTLSLGERMKCELAAALLHAPDVLFLDEPTIGMDVSMQLAVRDFVRDYNERHGATIVLTSHDMNDVAALCDRVLVIDGGELCFDGSIETLVRRIRPLRRVAVRLDGAQLDAQLWATLEALGEIVEGTTQAKPGGSGVALDVAPERVRDAVAVLLAIPGAGDLEVHDAPLEEVMREVFARGSRSAASAPPTADGHES